MLTSGGASRRHVGGRVVDVGIELRKEVGRLVVRVVVTPIEEPPASVTMMTSVKVAASSISVDRSPLMFFAESWVVALVVLGLPPGSAIALGGNCGDSRRSRRERMKFQHAVVRPVQQSSHLMR